jgi:hypothetical protein
VVEGASLLRGALADSGVHRDVSKNMALRRGEAPLEGADQELLLPSDSAGPQYSYAYGA